MVQYRTEYRQNPGSVQAAKLTNYVARGDDVAVVVRPSGVEASADYIDNFQDHASRSDLCRLHSFAFAENRSPDELISACRREIGDRLDGQYLISVDANTDGNNHIHVAQAGDWGDVYMDNRDIADIREAVAGQVGETVAANQVKA